MKFIADLHIHSKYSIATAKDLDLENLAIAAQLKGIKLIGTGDFTHPAWMNEIQQKLEPAEQGLYKLRKEVAAPLKDHVPDNLHGDVRFILQTEISNIYKKKGKTRKNHNLVFMPDLLSAQHFASKLSQIGNIHSDGRPILGLDAKELLSILLDVNENGFLIPAHIWTPWFSVLGSKSGFDCIEECFEDLTPHIFAVETGLSSDPAMNWRVKDLDRYTLISNSDAHSPAKIGREANLFNTALNYKAILRALKGQDKNGFLGTLEFFPEEGKYHLDGHRNCTVRLTPRETVALNGRCPVCGKKLTCGVLHRVEELASRSEEDKPVNARPYHKLVGLAALLAEILSVGPNTKKVQTQYQQALRKLGDELSILHHINIEEIARADIPMLAAAVEKMRTGRISISPGYDGAFGRIQVFSDSERQRLLHQRSLFFAPDTQSKKRRAEKNETNKEKAPELVKRQTKKRDAKKPNPPSAITLNKEQAWAVAHEKGPLLIVAGPGTGKTRTLTERIIRLIEVSKVKPQKILALTFTNKAAGEMQTRISNYRKDNDGKPVVGTFHAFCYKLLSGSLFGEKQNGPATIIDEDESLAIIKEAAASVRVDQVTMALKDDAVHAAIVAAKQRLLEPRADLSGVTPKVDLNVFTNIYEKYETLLRQRKLIDYEGLIFETIRKMALDGPFKTKMSGLFEYVFVDEYQDLNFGQYRLVKCLAAFGAHVCVIGDPDQSIYGFRGSDVRFFYNFINDYPGSTVIRLSRNYRSAQTILNGAQQLIHCSEDNDRDDSQDVLKRHRTYSHIKGVEYIELLRAPTARSEAVVVGKAIEKLIGGTGFHGYDSGKHDPNDKTATHSFSDIAVLMRTTAQIKIFAEVFQGAGIPFQLSTRGAIFKQKEFAAFLSYFKITEGLGTFTDLDRIVGWIKPGVGPKTLALLKKWGRDKGFSLRETIQNATRFPVPEMGLRRQQKLHHFIDRFFKTTPEKEGITVPEKLRRMVSRTPLRECLDDNIEMAGRFDWLVQMAGDHHADAKSFISALALVTDTDLYRDRAEKVSLMTMHAAKGLEFSVVFICGCEENLIPYTMIKKEASTHEEERRLLYVAMTRAKNRLVISWAGQRRMFGRTTAQKRSPFLNQIDTGLLLERATRRRRPIRQRQLGLFVNKP